MGLKGRALASVKVTSEESPAPRGGPEGGGEGQREVGRDSGRLVRTVGGGEGQWEVGRVGWQTEDEGEQLRVTG